MSSNKLYLKQNVVAEPLFNQWYAWSYLISPATAAMYTTNSHLKIMHSFISAPHVHITALKNPKMIGGAFINYDASRVDDIKNLLDKITKFQSHLIDFAAAIKELELILRSDAKGYSLEAIYQKVPDILKGYVELVYDLNNQPSIRFIEGLLYKSKYYNTSAQSIALSLINQDGGRSFAFSTPILKADKCLHLNIPFNSKIIDELFKIKNIPQPVEYIQELLGVPKKEQDKLTSLFTEKSPSHYVQYHQDVVRIRYFGHACILIEYKNNSILCDPIINYKYDNARENLVPRYTYEDLPERIDYVLITHNHQDHCMLETLLQLRHKIINLIVPKNNGGGLADPSLKLMLQNIGFHQVQEIDEMETISIEDGIIMGLPFLGEHADLNIRSKIAYLVNLQSNSILLAADSNNIETKLYKHIYDYLGEIKVIFVGMECDGGPLSWLYGPLLTQPLNRKLDQSRRLDGSDANKVIDLVSIFNPQSVYVYAMGQEPWLTFLTSIQYTQQSRPIVEAQKLIEECKQRGITAELLFGHKEIFLK
ncbi:MBL fold metallo-hydrolase [Chlorogloeopsis sp. ULAP02]|uniref:MBL fold metallo-hydrolase n=1 Tax=Chlorogloeopsis sp. ULAP02 TaxID=3107926 RepID=UPI0031368B9B